MEPSEKLNLISTKTEFSSKRRKKKINKMPIEAYKLIDYTNPVFVSYGIWTSVLVLKMLYMSVHTAIFRLKNQVRFQCEKLNFANNEIKIVM